MKNLFKYVMVYILYLFFLFICYNNYLINVYDYYGFKDELTFTSLIISFIIFVVSFVFVYKQKTDTYSKFILYILFVINFIPSVVTFCFMPFSYKYLFLLCVYWLMLIIFINFFNKIHVKSTSLKFNSNLFIIYLVVFVELIVMLLVLKYTGLNLNFDNVYTLRENYFESSIPVILSYMYSAFKVVNPLLFIYLFNRKKRIGCVITLIVQILAFLADGSKSTLFSIIIAFLIVKYIANRKTINFFENDKIKYYILLGIMGVNFLASIEFFLFESSYLYNYFVRRLFFVPSLLHNYYYDFFSVYQCDFFKQSILGKLGFHSVYNMPIQKIIGSVYFNAPSMLANNGLFSDAYMNLGVIGVFVLPFMLSVVLRLLDYSAKNINPFYLITVLISVSYVFISSSFFTVLLTHGYLLLCVILLFIIPRDFGGNDI